ncbi:MAG: type IV toxin-antitoxin system AbiEi family antitoxin [Candidatus Limnocylindrales bacterium]
MRSGISAASDHGIDVVAPGAIEVYVDRKRAKDLIRRYSLVSSNEPNVILHAVDIPSALHDREVMPLGVAIIDLLESGEPRAVSAARRAWGRLRPR